jgi:hypothetical protein
VQIYVKSNRTTRAHAALPALLSCAIRVVWFAAWPGAAAVSLRDEIRSSALRRRDRVRGTPRDAPCSRPPRTRCATMKPAPEESLPAATRRANVVHLAPGVARSRGFPACACALAVCWPDCRGRSDLCAEICADNYVAQWAVMVAVRAKRVDKSLYFKHLLAQPDLGVRI